MALHKYCKLSVYYDNETGCAKLKERDNGVWSCAIDSFVSKPQNFIFLKVQDRVNSD